MNDIIYSFHFHLSDYYSESHREEDNSKLGFNVSILAFAMHLVYTLSIVVKEQFQKISTCNQSFFIYLIK